MGDIDLKVCPLEFDAEFKAVLQKFSCSMVGDVMIRQVRIIINAIYAFRNVI